MRRRIDSFPGTDDEYVEFLEIEVVDLRKQVQLLSNVEAQTTTIPPSLQTATVQQTTHRTTATAPYTQSVDTPSTTATGPGLVELSAVVPQPTAQQRIKFTQPLQRDGPSPTTSNPRKRLASEVRECQNEALGGFRVHVWKPEEKRIKHTTSSSKIEWLVKHTPKANQWLSRIRETRLFDCVQSGNIISHLLESEPDVPLTQPAADTTAQREGSSAQVLVKRVMKFAHIAAQKEVDASVSLMVARFQQFVVLSACRILHETGKITSEDYKKVVTLCMGRNIEDKYCRRIMNTVLFLNRLIDALDARGWTRRAAELVILWNQNITFYIPLADSPDASLKGITSALCSTPFTEVVSDQSMDRENLTGLFVPVLVSQMLDKKVHITRIATALGYEHTHWLGTRDKDPFINPWLALNPP